MKKVCLKVTALFLDDRYPPTVDLRVSVQGHPTKKGHQHDRP